MGKISKNCDDRAAGRGKHLPGAASLFCLLLASLLAAAPLPALARDGQDDMNWAEGAADEQTLLFNEIPSVFSASKYEQKVTEAPSSVSIITSEEIRKYGYRNLAEILASIRGFFISNDRNYRFVGIRGFLRPGDYNSRVLLLIDGHRANDTIYESASIGNEFILDVDIIDRIEVVRGPSSSIYGTNAFFGVINVITKRGRDYQGLEASVDGGSFNTYKGRVTYGDRLAGGLEAMLSGTFYYSEGHTRLYYGEFDSPATNNGFADDSDDDRFYDVFGKFSYGDFTLEGAYVRRKKTIPTAAFETVFNDPRTNTVDAQAFVDVRYDRSFPELFDVLARVYYDNNYYHGDYVADYGVPPDPPDIVVNKDSSGGERVGAEFQLSRRLFEDHMVVFGAEYRYNFRQDQKNYDYEVYLDDHRDTMNAAVYIQDEYSVLDNLILNAGVRYDHYDTFGSTVNPRAALIYSPFDDTTVKLIYGRAFRAPTAYEFYYQDGGYTQKPNPDLEPETIGTYEVVLEQSFGRNLRGTAAGFYYRIDDLISQQTDPSDGLIIFRNVDEVEARGVELELDGRCECGFEGRVSYTFQQTEDRRTGRILSNSPKHLAKLNVILPLVKDRVFTGVEMQYTGKRRTLARDSAGGYFVTNLTLFTRELIKGMELSASVYNLFNKKYDNIGSGEHMQDLIEQDGISFRVKLTYLY